MALTLHRASPVRIIALSCPSSVLRLALIALTAGLFARRARAQAFPFPKPLDPAHIALADRDEAFNQHLQDTLLHDGYPGAYRELHEAFEKHPTPHIKAIYADYLLHEDAYSAPKGQIALAIQLAQEAEKDGSIHALAVMGWEHLSGARTPAESGSWDQGAATVG